jgi:hypothetical protein
MIDPSLVIFAIEAGVKLGRKVYEVLIDETVEKALLLPVGDLFGDIQEADAIEFFDRHENADLAGPKGPYAQLSRQEKILAYKTIYAIDERIGPSAGIPEGANIILSLHAFEQYKKGFGAKSPVQRILGTIVEIGIDYFAENPAALGKDSPARKALQSFIQGLNETDFAEGSPTQIVGDVLVAALRTFGENIQLVDDDQRVQALLGGVTNALIQDVQAAASQGELLRRERLVRRIASSLLLGAMGAVEQSTGLFVPRNQMAQKLIHSTLSQLLEGLRNKEDLFTNDSIELLFKSALGAVAENADLFSDQKILQELIRRTLTALTDTEGRKLFSEETVPAVLREALEVVRDNVGTLVDPHDPRQQLLASAASAVAGGLASTLAGDGKVKDLLSKSQLVELTKAVFQEVAKHPEQLLGDHLDDVKKTPLAQIIGSVACALGGDSARLVNGESLVKLVQSTLQVAVCNADKLIDLHSEDPRTNVLFKAIQQAASAVIESGDPRKLVTRTGFLKIIQCVLRVVSANADAFLAGESKPVKATVAKALELAGVALQSRINGANLPTLIDELLRAVLWGELDLTDTTAVELVSRHVLRAA